MHRTAVVLFNLGGPDGQAAVEPFLFNLFSDPAIITQPQPVRWLLAKVIARRRAPVARAIYDKIGGGSPLLANTIAQGRALEKVLGDGYRCFVAMRYWHPFSTETATEVAAWQPERIVLMPLYPQYSTTTTGSALADWTHSARRAGLSVPTGSLCCYPTEAGFVAALAAEIRCVLEGIPRGISVRLLFSAHGLPVKFVRGGDPYQVQVEATVRAVVAALAIEGLDHGICYQSRVGPLEWLGPSTDDEIRRAGRDRVGVVVVPVAFVSEHSETLVELDIEYRHLAAASGVALYRRVPTVGTHPAFIAGLGRLVAEAVMAEPRVTPRGAGICPASCRRCPVAAAARVAA